MRRIVGICLMLLALLAILFPVALVVWIVLGSEPISGGVANSSPSFVAGVLVSLGVATTVFVLAPKLFRVDREGSN